MAWWESTSYQSCCLPSEDSELEDLEDGEDETSGQLDAEDPDSTSIKYVSGDVTHPQAGAEDAVIVHCVGTKNGPGPWGCLASVMPGSWKDKAKCDLRVMIPVQHPFGQGAWLFAVRLDAVL